MKLRLNLVNFEEKKLNKMNGEFLPLSVHCVVISNSATYENFEIQSNMNLEHQNYENGRTNVR